MNELLSTESDNVWDHVAPHLDAGLGELSEPDRDALLLRYFEGKSAREMAQTLGVSDDAAQKRVSRAVDRLRDFFVKRGITVGASGLAVAISANAVQAAPVGLGAVITAGLAGTAAATIIATQTGITTMKIISTKPLPQRWPQHCLPAEAFISCSSARQMICAKQTMLSLPKWEK